MYTQTITGRCRDWQGREHVFRFSWATDAGIEWGNLYLDNSQRPEVLGFERLRSMDSAWPDEGQAFPEAVGPAGGWAQPQQKIAEVTYPAMADDNAK